MCCGCGFFFRHYQFRPQFCLECDGVRQQPRQFGRPFIRAFLRFEPLLCKQSLRLFFPQFCPVQQQWTLLELRPFILITPDERIVVLILVFGNRRCRYRDQANMHVVCGL